MTMRNRNTVLVAFMLVAVMLMAVGFATLTDDLLVTGTGSLSKDAAQDEVDKDVYFSAISGVENCTAVISAADTSNDTIAVTIDDDTCSMAVAGDTATFGATVQNDTNVTVWLTFAHTASTNFEMYVVDGQGSHNNGSDGTFAIAAGESIDINVVVELLNTISADISAETFTIDVIASTTDPSTITP